MKLFIILAVHLALVYGALPDFVGDVNQLPYIERENLFEIKYSSSEILASISQELFCTRCNPMDVAYVLSEVYPAGLNVKKCPRNSPSTSKCIIKGIDALRPNLKQGIPALNIPRIEPFKMKYVELDAEIPGLILKGDGSNIVARGASQFQLKDIKLDLQNYVMEAHIFIPQLNVTADYETHGSKLYLINISGSGQFKGTFTDVDAIVRISGHPMLRNGVEFAKIDDVTANISFGSGLLDCTPDVSSLKASGAAAFVKSNSMTVLKMIGPVINKAAGPIILKYVAKIMNVIPLSDLFTS